jgi:hypothetical protein
MRLTRILLFLRITDEQNNISLTNLAIWLVLGKMALTPELAAFDIGALLIAYMNYAGKKIIQRRDPTVLVPENTGPIQSDISNLYSQLKDIRDKIGGLALAQGLKPKSK